MQISSRFTVAVHILALLAVHPSDVQTSETIAASVNTNPVVIRRIMSQLKKAQLIQIQRGSSGIKLLKPASLITLLAIYQAVIPIEHQQLFRVHQDCNPNCDVGAHIQVAIESTLNQAQQALENRLKNVTLQDITNNIKSFDL